MSAENTLTLSVVAIIWRQLLRLFSSLPGLKALGLRPEGSTARRKRVGNIPKTDLVGFGRLAVKLIQRLLIACGSFILRE